MSRKPLLLLDIDGCVSPRGAASGCKIVQLGGWKIPVSPVCATELPKLSSIYHVVWCTDWRESANVLGAELGLPELPFVNIGAHEPSGWRKLTAVQSYLAGHDPEIPIAWADDQMTPTAKTWVQSVAHRTLVIRPNPLKGLLEDEFSRLRAFASS